MDLSDLSTKEAADDGAVLELRGPTGAPIMQDDGAPVTITLLGADSDVLTRVANQQTNRYLRDRGAATMTAEGATANRIDYLAAATVAWSGIKVDGDVLDCTRDEARKLYRRFPFIRDQASAFVDDRANFLKASPKT